MRAMRSFFVLLICIVLTSCAGYRRALATAPVGASPTYVAAKLMIFGGYNHKVYLGCLSCSEYVTDSVNNDFGPNGSEYQSNSIKNHFSEYGSPYSMYSACNPYASDPPVIVDNSGHYYGRLTLNTAHPEYGSGARFYDWLEGICGS